MEFFLPFLIPIAGYLIAKPVARRFVGQRVAILLAGTGVSVVMALVFGESLLAEAAALIAAADLLSSTNPVDE